MPHLLTELKTGLTALVAYTRVAHEGGFDVAEFPNVERWVSRVEGALSIGHAMPKQGVTL